MLNQPWPSLKDRLLSGVDKVCGKTKGGPVPHNETWWWNDAVNDIVKEKQKNWKQGNLGGSTEEYHLAKKKLQAALCMMLNSKPSQNVFKT